MNIKNIAFIFILFAIQSCNNSKLIATKSEKKSIEKNIFSNERNMQKDGVDFFAEGKTPVSWSLKINYDDTVYFMADDGLILKIAFNQLKKDTTNEGKLFSGKISGGQFQITVSNNLCVGENKKTTQVNFNGKKYEGCGNFLADGSLNGKWLLEKIGNITINTSEYNKPPTLLFELKNNKFSGNDGCNNMSGMAEVQGNRISFGPLLTTKMGCVKKSIEKIISQKINNQLVSYYFIDGKLFLYLIDDSLLIFKKEI